MLYCRYCFKRNDFLNKNKLFVFFCLCAIFVMAASFAHPVTPSLIIERNLNSAIFGTAYAAMQTTMFLFSPFWGKLCDYYPTKRIMLISSIGYALGQVIFGAAQNEAMVYLGRIFAGCFTGGAFTAFSNHVIHISDPESRGPNLTAMITIQSVGSALGYFVGGFLALISIEIVFIVQIITLALCGVLFQLFCLDDTAFVTKPEHPITFREVNPFRAFASARTFMTPMLGLLFAIVVFSGIGYNAYEQSFNYYIRDQFHLSSAYNGTVKIVIAVMTIVLNSTVCLYLQKHTNISKSFQAILLLTPLPIASVILLRSQVPFFAAYLIYCGLQALRAPLMQTLVANRATGKDSNSVMGFYQSMNSLGSIFGSFFAGLIYSANPTYPFVLSFAAFVVACVFGARYVRRSASSD